MATSGDFYLATSGDFFMATDTMNPAGRPSRPWCDQSPGWTHRHGRWACVCWAC